MNMWRLVRAPLVFPSPTRSVICFSGSVVSWDIRAAKASFAGSLFWRAAKYSGKLLHGTASSQSSGTSNLAGFISSAQPRTIVFQM